ncbi:DUF1360 domain-containing protein [Peribacillus cavernae]|uniref:DUF1360 domain-containing protein n=1 Tax=Peribacillus cavernae TaxID=1674310 RepID=A0A3S0VLA2_9BACI|nr:DUF1360 domain-containing protein [Peribacillus cavernae]MDQ0217467.1 hypothetical protein [Peribacillus cavernae]RUQ30090.1 DUF1360 domain-containing protein [Peribacillus cavernae]
MLENTNLTVIILLGLAAFRLTRLIVYDKITEFLRRPFFDEIEETGEDGVVEIYLTPRIGGVRGWVGELLSCYWCTGVWVSMLLAGLYVYQTSIGNYAVIVLAIAAISSIIETIISKLIGY